MILYTCEYASQVFKTPVQIQIDLKEELDAFLSEEDWLYINSNSLDVLVE